MNLVQDFERLWDSADAPPDVLAFLLQQTTVDSDQWLAVLLSDQRRRWLTENPLQVEDYLAGLPGLPTNVDWKPQLAIGEFEARRDTDRPLSQHEICSRFPELSDTLRQRLQVLIEIRNSSGASSVDQTAHTRGDASGQSSGSLEMASTVIGGQSPQLRSADSDDDQELPARIGEYAVRNVLGRGAFGCVYLANDSPDGPLVALKVLHQHRANDSQIVEQFCQEAKMLERLQHSAIVRFRKSFHNRHGSRVA